MVEEAPALGEFVCYLKTLFAENLCSPICVAEHLVPFLPKHHMLPESASTAIDPVAAAPWGSASIAIISWAYIKMLGGKGLNDSSKMALLSANYMASRLAGHYTLRYKNENDRVAHELLIDLAEFGKSAGLKVNDFAKRLQVKLAVLRAT
jgi:glycine dehydrogenase